MDIRLCSSVRCIGNSTRVCRHPKGGVGQTVAGLFEKRLNRNLFIAPWNNPPNLSSWARFTFIEIFIHNFL